MSPLCLHQPTPSRDVLLVPMAAHSKPVSPKALPYYSLCTPEHNSWTQDEGLIAPKSLLDLPITPNYAQWPGTLKELAT